MSALTIETEEQLDDLLTTPDASLVEFMRTLRGPLLVLGASGKMGPTLAVLAARAGAEAGNGIEVIAASRFSDSAARRWLESRGVTTIACDLLEREDVDSLPDTPHIIYMAGRKFGTSDNPSLTWAMNMLAPAHVCERYPEARIVALSTGCVYPLIPVEQEGSKEEDALTPVGEYSNACVARERIFEYYSQRNGTPVVQIRLNYAIDLRYGVLVDIAGRVLAGQPVDVSMGYFNCIWQGDANAMILRALDLAASPQASLNLTCREVLSVRDVAQRFGRVFGKDAIITGSESPTALLNDPSKAYRMLGEPETSLDIMIERIGQWMTSGGRLLGKPTHYEVRDGEY